MTQLPFPTPGVPGNPLPSDISKPEMIYPTPPVGPGFGGGATPDFEAAMRTAGTLPQEGPASTLSPLDLAKGAGAMPSMQPTMDTLGAQINRAQNTLQDLSAQASFPNLKINPSTRFLLNKKLTDANTHIHSALTTMRGASPFAQAGQEQAALAAEAAQMQAGNAPPVGGPMGKLLGFITNGMSSLEAAKNQMQNIKETGHQLNGASMLQIQVKLFHAQQLIEFSSVLLANAVNDFKTLMNIQL